MTAHYSDETLMAFADGMLDEPLFSAVAEAVDRDPALAARLEQLVDGAALARQGFAPLLQPVPPELEASVKAMITRQERKRSAATPNSTDQIPQLVIPRAISGLGIDQGLGVHLALVART